MRTFTLLPATLLLLLSLASAAPKDSGQSPLSNSVEVFSTTMLPGYDSIRTPCVMRAGATMLAVARGFRKDRYAPVDIIASTSSNGKKWFKPTVVASYRMKDHKSFHINNPCVVYERENKRFLLLYQDFPKDAAINNYSTGATGDKCVRIYLCTSKNGRNWSKPKDITALAKPSGWAIPATSSPSGIHINRGTHKGRLVVPMNDVSYFLSNDYGFAAVYSDNQGKTWQAGKKAATPGLVCEAPPVLTEAGDLLVLSNARYSSTNARKALISYDGGESWSGTSAAEILPWMDCLNGFVRYSFASDEKLGGKGRLLFSSPGKRRENGVLLNGTIYMSYDDGKTWPISRSLGEDVFSGSSLCSVRPGTMGILYENGGLYPITSICFTTFSLKWLTEGEDSGTAASEKE